MTIWDISTLVHFLDNHRLEIPLNIFKTLGVSKLLKSPHLSFPTSAASSSSSLPSMTAFKQDLNLKPLEGEYFVVLDATGQHRPIMVKQYPPNHLFHPIKILPNTLESPFSKSTTSVTHSFPSQVQKAPAYTFSVTSLPTTPPPPPVYASTEDPYFQRDLSTLTFPSKDLLPRHSRTGTCERCHVHYEQLERHLESSSHLKFKHDMYWSTLDPWVMKLLPRSLSNEFSTSPLSSLDDLFSTSTSATSPLTSPSPSPSPSSAPVSFYHKLRHEKKEKELEVVLKPIPLKIKLKSYTEDEVDPVEEDIDEILRDPIKPFPRIIFTSPRCTTTTE
ncbi:hypothetical protein HMI55_003751 [Coelomomyces lativittatus]|nr:hypothetical protein HMI55_003751 [Coelomomyces lativittatus]KAJ1513707.1 hypothetical protein HMI56_001929 [Coelomomyces lativittatus]